MLEFRKGGVISYLTQQAPATIKASDPATMKTLLMTEKKYIQTVRGSERSAGLLLSVDDMIPD